MSGFSPLISCNRSEGYTLLCVRRTLSTILVGDPPAPEATQNVCVLSSFGRNRREEGLRWLRRAVGSVAGETGATSAQRFILHI